MSMEFRQKGKIKREKSEAYKLRHQTYKRLV